MTTQQGMPSMTLHQGSNLADIAEYLQELHDWLEEFRFGASEDSVGTVLSGVNGIIAGTTELADVLVADRGSLVTEQDAQNDNSTAAASADFMATASPVFSVGSALSGTISTGVVTISISGGTAPYTITSAFVSGDDEFTEVITGSPLASDGDVTVYYTIPHADGLYKTAVEKITVTDNVAGTAELNISITAFDTKGIGG